MRRLIESLLQLARIDDGAETLPRENIDLARVAADCAELVRPLAAERNITLDTDLSAANCLGNSDQLALAVTNLLTNAVQHIADSGIVRLTTRVESGAVVLSVADDGPGVAEEHLPHLFERFYRADAARSAHTGGAGLGLAIVKASVDACGGSVVCHNVSPRGFEVKITFPSNP
jgi:two-component system phosphate regulon sensor histidine kinase PhoR